MANTKFTAELRKKSGKNDAVRLRSEGLIPAVVYGRNKETKEICINEREIGKILSEVSKTSILKMKLEEELVPVVIKDIQRHPTESRLLHADFQVLSENEKIKINVPIKFDNMSALTKTTAVLSHPLTEIYVQCYPKDIPKHSIHIDAIKLKPGQVLQVKDLPLFNDESIEILEDAEAIVASMTDVKEVKVEVEAEEA
jgi:large subunit ribosomal protein L25